MALDKAEAKLPSMQHTGKIRYYSNTGRYDIKAITSPPHRVVKTNPFAFDLLYLQ